MFVILIVPRCNTFLSKGISISPLDIYIETNKLSNAKMLFSIFEININWCFAKFILHIKTYREFMCVSLSFDEKSSTCWLFNHNKESLSIELSFKPSISHYQRIFYKGGAVIDEVYRFIYKKYQHNTKLRFPLSL